MGDDGIIEIRWGDGWDSTDAFLADRILDDARGREF
jgi:hypothetical protein